MQKTRPQPSKLRRRIWKFVDREDAKYAKAPRKFHRNVAGWSGALTAAQLLLARKSPERAFKYMHRGVAGLAGVGTAGHLYRAGQSDKALAPLVARNKRMVQKRKAKRQARWGVREAVLHELQGVAPIKKPTDKPNPMAYKKPIVGARMPDRNPAAEEGLLDRADALQEFVAVMGAGMAAKKAGETAVGVMRTGRQNTKAFKAKVRANMPDDVDYFDDVMERAIAALEGVEEGFIMPANRLQQQKLKKRSTAGHVVHTGLRAAAGGGMTPLGVGNAARYMAKVGKARRGEYTGKR